MKQQLTWDHTSYLINGERQFLVSGEVQYFRVPKADWETRLRLLKDAGGNCVATYVPWILHEPTEGDIRFDDIPQRELEQFLLLCKSLELFVICRPGPYQYAELRYDGLPGWLCEQYPEILARTIQGEPFRGSSVSYLHPVFLEKVKTWFDAVCPLLARHMVSRGGAVAMVQLDNELMGIHEWFGGWDYNADTMGFGSEDGRYARFLQGRYGDLHAVNAAYETAYTKFGEVHPSRRQQGAEHGTSQGTGQGAGAIRMAKDYQSFYFQTNAEYLHTLYGWVREAGIDCQLVHNSANPNMNAYFLEAKEKLGTALLLGSDHYYNLNQDWDQNNPTPQYAINIFYSNEMLRLMGYPPTIFELPGGSFSDWPPVTREDLLCCYMTNTALGMKGSNYYIFTGGPNPEGVSHYGELYDYGASVGALGEIRPTYKAQQTFGAFLQQHAWLAGAERVADFYIGLDWEQSRSKHYFADRGTLGFSNSEAWRFARKGMITTAFCASYACNLVDLTDQAALLRLNGPLWVSTSACMSAAIQRNLVAFVQEGGQLLLAPVIPELDEHFNRCTILADFLQSGGSRPLKQTSPVLSIGAVRNVLMNGSLWGNETRPPAAEQVAVEENGGTEIGWRLPVTGGGSVLWLGFHWSHSKHEHGWMLADLLGQMGCSAPIVRCSNPNVWTSVRTDGKRSMLFVMNLLSARMLATVEAGGMTGDTPHVFDLELQPMEVRVLELGEGE